MNEERDMKKVSKLIFIASLYLRFWIEGFGSGFVVFIKLIIFDSNYIGGRSGFV